MPAAYTVANGTNNVYTELQSSRIMQNVEKTNNGYVYIYIYYNTQYIVYAVVIGIEKITIIICNIKIILMHVNW